MLTTEQLSQLDRTGHVEGVAELGRGELVQFFSAIGSPLSSRRHPELVRDIRPQAVREAPLNTLSSRYGMGTFPLHTDGAHWRLPPHFLVLYCVNPGAARRVTLLADPLAHASEEELIVLRRATWNVIGVRAPFTARVLDGVGGQEYLRFDSNCMKPTGRGYEALDVVTSLTQRVSSIEVQWAEHKFLVIDNWRLVHARGEAAVADPDRHHWRVLLG